MTASSAIFLCRTLNFPEASAPLNALCAHIIDPRRRFAALASQSSITVMIS